MTENHGLYNPAGNIYVCSLHIICCDHDCLPTSYMKHRVFSGSPPRHIDKSKAWFIRLVEKLHTADNPAEIAHGFPVPNVENKHTPVEYLMKGPENIHQTEVQSPHPCEFQTEITFRKSVISTFNSLPIKRFTVPYYITMRLLHCIWVG